jgi:hypothetical protein
MLWVRERTPTPSSSVGIFTFGFTFESFKKFEGASMLISWNIMKGWKCFESENHQVYFELDALIICGHPIRVPYCIHLEPITP